MADSLSAPDYIRENFQPPDRIAILLRNRNRGEVIQRITAAEKIATPEFQAWLAFKNLGGFDIYISMNTLKPGSYRRTKQDIETVRHLYADLDYDGSRANPLEGLGGAVFRQFSGCDIACHQHDRLLGFVAATIEC